MYYVIFHGEVCLSYEIGSVFCTMMLTEFLDDSVFKGERSRQIKEP